jgi:hypothetical protein
MYIVTLTGRALGILPVFNITGINKIVVTLSLALHTICFPKHIVEEEFKLETTTPSSSNAVLIISCYKFLMR